jgi:hypothetical protein
MEGENIPLLTLLRSVFLKSKTSDRLAAEDCIRCTKIKVSKDGMTVEVESEEYGSIRIPLSNINGWQMEETDGEE